MFGCGSPEKRRKGVLEKATPSTASPKAQMKRDHLEMSVKSAMKHRRLLKNKKKILSLRGNWVAGGWMRVGVG